MREGGGVGASGGSRAGAGRTEQPIAMQGVGRGSGLPAPDLEAQPARPDSGARPTLLRSSTTLPSRFSDAMPTSLATTHMWAPDCA